MKKIITSLAAFALTVLGVGALVTATAAPAYAVNTTPAGQYLTSANATGNADNLPSMISTIINFALGVIGLMCVVIIIIGGVTYATSQGDSGKVSKATKTLLYGVVGLVVCLLAFAIVNFVLTGISGTGA